MTDKGGHTAHIPRNDGVGEAIKEKEALRAPRNDAVGNL